MIGGLRAASRFPVLDDLRMVHQTHQVIGALSLKGTTR